MPTLHDAVYRAQLVDRVKALQPGAQRRWGSMTVDQMLWHVNDVLALTIGEMTVPPHKVPIPRALLKFVVLNLPWGKNAPTHPSFIATKNYDFAAERERCLRLIDKAAAIQIDGEWPAHPAFGRLTGRQASRLQAKHLNHHLTQFGV